MKKLALAFGAMVLLAAGTSSGEAAKLTPGYYAHSLLVFGNASERHAAGCLRWHWQNRSWYDHCRAERRNVLVVKY